MLPIPDQSRGVKAELADREPLTEMFRRKECAKTKSIYHFAHLYDGNLPVFSNARLLEGDMEIQADMKTSTYISKNKLKLNDVEASDGWVQMPTTKMVMDLT